MLNSYCDILRSYCCRRDPQGNQLTLGTNNKLSSKGTMSEDLSYHSLKPMICTGSLYRIEQALTFNFIFCIGVNVCLLTLYTQCLLIQFTGWARWAFALCRKTLACIWTDRWIVIWTDLSAVGALRQSGLA